MTSLMSAEPLAQMNVACTFTAPWLFARALSCSGLTACHSIAAANNYYR